MENHHLNVLLIEDDRIDQEVVKERLERDYNNKYVVKAVSSLKEAFEFAATKNWDIIITDLSLPDSVNQQKTIESIHETLPNVPIVVLTGNEDLELAATLIRSGAQDYIVKSEVCYQLLARTIREAIERERLKKENEHMRAELERLSTLDPLTELLNRRGLERAFGREVAWASRYKTELFLMFMDIDNFKPINDQFGHMTGDDFLKKVGQLMTQNVRKTDYVARFGGDEFILLLQNTNSENVTKVAERLKEVIKHVMLDDGKKIDTSISISIVPVPLELTTLQEVLRQADEIVLSIKRSGKNKIVLKNLLPPAA